MPNPRESNEDNSTAFTVPHAAIRPTRLIPYAKDHDRLQLALLYIEANDYKLKDVEFELRILRMREKQLEAGLKRLSTSKEREIERYLRVHHPAEYTNSSGEEPFPFMNSQSSFWGDLSPPPDPDDPKYKSERVIRLRDNFNLERMDSGEMRMIHARIAQIEEAQGRAKEYATQKVEILRLIDELYATAFDGHTPEFPHEDEIEGLVEIAEAALKSEKAVLDSIPRETVTEMSNLVRLVDRATRVAVDIQARANEIFEMFQMDPTTLTKFRGNDLYKARLPQRLELGRQRCQVLKEELTRYLDAHPQSALHGMMVGPGSRVQDQVPIFTVDEMIQILCRALQGGDFIFDARREFFFPFEKLNQVAESIKKIERQVMVAQQAVQSAETMLQLRRRQLAATRCHILDHVADPDKCALERPEDRLPQYPEQIIIHRLPRHDPRVNTLLQRAERYAPEQYVNDVVRARLNRARRTTHPPILNPARYQPPVYHEIEDTNEVQLHCGRIVPPCEGATPAYSEEPDYEGNVLTKPGWVRSVVDKELEPLMENARNGLFQRTPMQGFASMQGFVNDLLNQLLAAGGFPISAIRPR